MSNFDEISQSTADIKLLPVLENGRPPYWNFISGFDFDLCVVIGMTFCILRMHCNLKPARCRASRSGLFGPILYYECAQTANSQLPVKILTSPLVSVTRCPNREIRWGFTLWPWYWSTSDATWSNYVPNLSAIEQSMANDLANLFKGAHF